MAELQQGVRVDVDRYRTHAVDSATLVMVVELIHNPRAGAAQSYRQHSHMIMLPVRYLRMPGVTFAAKEA